VEDSEAESVVMRCPRMAVQLVRQNKMACILHVTCEVISFICSGDADLPMYAEFVDLGRS
jgi:hypothetical protein